MGACCSANRTSSQIESKMSEEQHYEKTLNKLLFLGPGGSGKSTIFRQLQWLHGGGMNVEDRQEFKQYIDHQIIRQMQDAIRHYLCEPVADETLQNAINTVKSYDRNGELTGELARDITYIWKSDTRLNGIFRIVTQTKILQESTEYFWNNIDRITTDDYTPNKTDIINVRNMTTGIIEKKFTVQTANVNFHIFDVGGQRSERKKWFRCFDGVRAVVFVLALSSYNELMFEDNKTNQMVDTLELWDNTIHHEMFIKTPIILFLNKKDLFEIKIKDVPITECAAFSDFGKKLPPNAAYIHNNPNDYVQTASYVQSKFEQINKTETREIFSHITCAMDYDNVKNVFNDVVLVVIRDMSERLDIMCAL